jgi:hypothetical protein
MRTVLLAGLVAALCLSLIETAEAERRMFVVGSNGGYGIDRCLASGAPCGAAAAAAYCKSQQFAQAASYRKIDRDDITGAISSSGASGCKGSTCDDIVAIVCTR